MDITPVDEKPHRWHRIFDRILLLLAALMLPMLYLEYGVGVAEPWRRFFYAYYFFIWALFSVEFALKLVHSRSKILFLRQHWISLFIVVFPFMRIMRLFRPVELAFVMLTEQLSRRVPLFRVNHLFNFIVFVVFVVIISAELILHFEGAHPGSNIKSLGDALWWSTVGISTVGIGNIVPATFAGKILNLLLALVGIFIFALLTAQFTDVFITEERIQKILEHEEEYYRKRLLLQNEEVLKRLEAIEQRLRKS